MAAKSSSTTGKILRNSAWIGLETLVEALVLLISSVAVARYLGPQKLGYFSYINFFVGIVTRTSGDGLASATRKYMAEYLALDRPGMARAVFNFAYRYQFIGACVISTVGLVAVLLYGSHGYRLMASILMISIIPGVMSWVPAQANNAFENASHNTISALAYIGTYATCIALTLHFHWDLVGVTCSLLAGRTVEVTLRTFPLRRRLAALPLDQLDNETKKRIRKYCFEAFGIQLLMAVVWDRSEMVFLRAFGTLQDIAFYSVSFGLANNLLVLPRTFAGATGLSLMVEAKRDPDKVNSIVQNASRYLLFIVLPVNLGAAAITKQAVGFAYGPRYAGAVPVLIASAILSIPKGFMEIPETLIKAADKQKLLLIWFAVAGVVNLGFDALLIPHYKAVGAAIGNGLGQAFGVIAIWIQARRMYEFRFPFGSALRLFVSATTMAIIAFLVARLIPNLLGTLLAVAAATPIYLVLVKLFRGLQPGDRSRLMSIGTKFPGPMRNFLQGAIMLATPLEKQEVVQG